MTDTIFRDRKGQDLSCVWTEIEKCWMQNVRVAWWKGVKQRLKYQD